MHLGETEEHTNGYVKGCGDCSCGSFFGACALCGCKGGLQETVGEKLIFWEIRSSLRVARYCCGGFCERKKCFSKTGACVMIVVKNCLELTQCKGRMIRKADDSK